MKLRRYLGCGVALALLVVVVVWQMRARSQPQGVQVVEARGGPFTLEWSAVGYVESRSAQVTAPQVGRVSEVLVREGDRVRLGQALARLSREAEVAGLSAQVAGADVAAAQAAAAEATLLEAQQSQRERERRASLEIGAARARHDQAGADLARSRRLLPAQEAAARAEMAAARARLDDLERGSRPEEIAQAEADVRAAEATATWCRSELDRYTALNAEGAASRTAVESAREAAERADAALRGRREALALARKGARPDQIATARHQHVAAESRWDAAKAELASLDIVARKVDEALAGLRSAESALREAKAGRAMVASLRKQLAAARSRLDQAHAGSRQAAAVLTDRDVVAPFSGIVGRRFVDPGDMASPAQPLFSLVEPGRTWVAAEVDEQDLAPLREGQKVAVSAPAFQGRSFAGRIALIGGEAVPQTEIRTGARIVRVRVSLEPTPAADRALLRPGMEVHVSGSARVVDETVTAASDAIVSSGGETRVWVVEGGVARSRRVRTGYVSGPKTEIVEGVRPGEKLVVGGKEGLTDGARVRPEQATAGSP